MDRKRLDTALNAHARGELRPYEVSIVGIVSSRPNVEKTTRAPWKRCVR